MGNTSSRTGEDQYNAVTGRAIGITGGGALKRVAAPKLPAGAVKSSPEDYSFIEETLNKVLVFNKMERHLQRKVVSEMYERTVSAGEILIKEGDTGLAAAELYVVKSGKFEVLQRRQGVNFRVNLKEPGDVFGELALMYNCPRTATVAATTDAAVWVLEREVLRYFLRNAAETQVSEVELFLNSVPILNPLSQEEKLQLVDAFEEKTYKRGEQIVVEGEDGDYFYIIKEGEAVVHQSTPGGQRRKVNHLFRADFFGERALLVKEPRIATVEAVTPLTVLALARGTFLSVLGPLEELLKREKSPQVIAQRLSKLGTFKKAGAPGRLPAEVLIKRRKRGRNGEVSWEVVRARGHLDEVLEMCKGGCKLEDLDLTKETPTLILTEGAILGGGAFSRVSEVTEESTGNTYAMKRMRKSAVVQCPEHVYFEQAITKNTAHPFCIRQYATFQDKYHLYFLFDLMPGGDLMDVLVAEAKVIRQRVPSAAWQVACLAPKVKMLQGMPEDLARFYIASIVLALEYLHASHTVYRDLKPENVFIDAQGYVKIGDFGFAKVLESNNRTYTFCGTPGYVAPENVLAHGYNYSVDWWGLGVLMYVLLTGRQPFSSPKTDDPMVVMRRIVDENYVIKYPPFLSPAAKDLIQKLLERKPAKRLGMLSGKAQDVKRHRWFEGMDWAALEARRAAPPRRPKDTDSAKRLKDLLENERKGQRPNKESPDEMQECESVFKDF
uniref:cGMP-dependent protein kinase n=1 Tax=Tetradesmus obliquus TaxID=3088 RepID=A0A383WC48_TETOB|eukprot:jgi/Sobl393_1/2411/SZX75011.1